MGQKGASAIDTPPLSMAEVKTLANELRQSTANLARDSNALLPDFERIWNQIGLVAKKENLTVEQVLGILSISAASMSRSGLGTADAVGAIAPNPYTDRVRMIVLQRGDAAAAGDHARRQRVHEPLDRLGDRARRDGRRRRRALPYQRPRRSHRRRCGRRRRHCRHRAER